MKKIQTRVRRIERPIEHIIVHCSATPQGKDFGADDIDRWHRNKGLDLIGYHYVVRLDGTVERGRDLFKAGAHCNDQYRDYDSIGVCYIGGLDDSGEPCDTRTPEQRTALRALLQTLKGVWPLAKISGHRDWAPSRQGGCPCFDARQEYADITGDVYMNR